ncbi:MAG: hypothetical protein Fur0037_20610 [Planctomycetota bacterium]
MATNYWDYIRVKELLALQGGLEGDDRALSADELRFIAIHQIDELWFKLAIRELETARDLFARDRVPETALSGAALALERVTKIFRLAAQHFELMETMRTQDYLEFRDKLSPASGFQSAQMREIEILMGLEDRDRIPFGNEKSYLDALRAGREQESPALKRVLARLGQRRSLRQALDGWLSRAPIDGSTPDAPGDPDRVSAFLAAYLEGHERLRDRELRTTVQLQALAPEDQERLRRRHDEQLEATRRYLLAEDVGADRRPWVRRIRAAILFIDSYRELPLLSWPARILDAAIEAEQAILIFRQRHARMVERVIGRRIGTGGSDGVEYLDRTALAYRVFSDLWAARTMLLPSDLLPPLSELSFYGLVAE